MNTQEIKKALIDAGAKVWIKDEHERVYINTNEQLEAIGAKVVDSPKYAGETRGISSKSKMYFDLKKELFFVESGSMKNTINECGFKAARI